MTYLPHCIKNCLPFSLCPAQRDQSLTLTKDDTPPLNFYYLSSPNDLVRHEKLHSFAWNTLVKISVVASIAIAASVALVAFGLVTLSGGMPLVFAGLALASIPLNISLPHICQKARAHKERLALETQVAQKYEEIKDQDSSYVQSFFQKHELTPPDTSAPQINYLPLIARFEVYQEIQKRLQTKTTELLNTRLDADPERTELGRQLVLDGWEEGWNQLESKELPALLELAVILRLLEKPDTQERSINKLVRIHPPQTFLQREWAKQSTRGSPIISPLPGKGIQPVDYFKVIAVKDPATGEVTQRLPPHKILRLLWPKEEAV